MRDTRIVLAIMVPGALLVLLIVSLNLGAETALTPYASGVLLSILVGSGTGAVFYLRKGLSASTLQSSIRVEQTGRQLKQTLAVRLSSRNHILRRIARKRSEALKHLVATSGLTLSPYALACDYIFTAFVSFVVVLPMAVTLSFFSRYFLLVLLLPPLIVFVPDLMLRAAARERGKALEAELPYFTSFVAAMEAEGLPVYDSLMTATGKGVLIQTEKEGLMASRNSTFFGNDSTSSLEAVGRLHPNDDLADLFLGYTSVLRLGADTGRFLREKMSLFLMNMKEGYRRHDVSSLVQVLMLSALWGLLVLGGVYSSEKLSPATASQVDLFGLLAMLLVSGLVYLLVSDPGPVPKESSTGSTKVAILSFIATVLFFSAQKEAVLAILGGTVSFLASYGMTVLLRQRESEMTSSALPAFIREVTERVKSGAEIGEAVVLSADSRSYGSPLDAYLRDVSMELRLGRRLSEISTRMRSWLGNFTFFFLGQASEYGAGATALEALHESVASTVRARREVAWARNLTSLVSFAAPVAFVLTLISLTGVHIQFSLDSPVSGALGSVFTNVLLGSLTIALVVTRALDHSSRNFMRVAQVFGEVLLLFAVLSAIS